MTCNESKAEEADLAAELEARLEHADREAVVRLRRDEQPVPAQFRGGLVFKARRLKFKAHRLKAHRLVFKAHRLSLRHDWRTPMGRPWCGSDEMNSRYLRAHGVDGNLRTTTSPKYEAVPRRARIQGS